MSYIYNPSSVALTEIEYQKNNVTDRDFIPVNAPGASMADQLAQCKAVSPPVSERVAP